MQHLLTKAIEVTIFESFKFGYSINYLAKCSTDYFIIDFILDYFGVANYPSSDSYKRYY